MKQPASTTGPQPVKASVFMHPDLHRAAKVEATRRGETLSEFMAKLAALETGWKSSNKRSK